MINLTIDGKKIQVEEGKTILEAAKIAGIEIPTLCYHKALPNYGACRMCIVEIKEDGKKRIEASCTYSVCEGQDIQTASPKIIKHRKVIIELLLASSPDSVQIKELAEKMGVAETRFTKRHDDCTLCGLCVRMCAERMGPAAVGFINRGYKRKVDTPFGELSDVCQTCGACVDVCPTGKIKLEEITANKPRAILSEFEEGLKMRRPVYIPFPQAVPNVPVIDREKCVYFLQDTCKVCEEFCEAKAIKHDQEDELVKLNAGAVILSSGFKLFDSRKVPHYGYGRLDNVITSLEFERISHASGPTGGKILLKNGKPPKSVAILHCIGSRDAKHNPYCSRVCCMYALKIAHLVREKIHADVYQCYIDMRAYGKGYEEFYERLMHEDVKFIRGKAAEVTDIAETEAEKGKLIVKCEDTLLGEKRRIPVDMVILCGALEPAADAKELNHLFTVSSSKDGFFLEKHPKLAPVATASDGIFVAGCAQGPKDIPDSVAQGLAAAAEALSLMDRGKIEVEPITAVIDEDKCSGCRICNELCSYSAIEFIEDKKVSRINEVLCKGCGTCVAACPSGIIAGRHFTDEEIFSEIEGILT